MMGLAVFLAGNVLLHVSAVKLALREERIGALGSDTDASQTIFEAFWNWKGPGVSASTGYRMKLVDSCDTETVRTCALASNGYCDDGTTTLGYCGNPSTTLPNDSGMTAAAQGREGYFAGYCPDGSGADGSPPTEACLGIPDTQTSGNAEWCISGAAQNPRDHPENIWTVQKCNVAGVMAWGECGVQTCVGEGELATNPDADGLLPIGCASPTVISEAFWKNNKGYLMQIVGDCAISHVRACAGGCGDAETRGYCGEAAETRGPGTCYWNHVAMSSAAVNRTGWFTGYCPGGEADASCLGLLDLGRAVEGGMAFGSYDADAGAKWCMSGNADCDVGVAWSKETCETGGRWGACDGTTTCVKEEKLSDDCSSSVITPSSGSV